MLGDRLALNLGPLPVAAGDRLQLNLGVAWDVGEPPVEPEFSGLWATGYARYRSAVAYGAQSAIPWGMSARVAASPGMAWRAAYGREAVSRLAWGSFPALASRAGVRWSEGAHRDGASRSAWFSLPTRHASAMSAWAVPAVLSVRTNSSWLASPTHRSFLAERWRAAQRTGGRQLSSFWLSADRHELTMRFPWRGAPLAQWSPTTPVPPPEPPIPPGFPSGNRIGLHLGCPLSNVRGIVPLNLGVVACYGVRPAQRSYIVINTLEVVRLPDRTPIDVVAVSINGSAASFAWDLQMALARGSDETLLQPTASGPARVEVRVNGFAWVFIVESRSRSREWSDQGLDVAVTIAGRSPSALLASPYAPVRSKVSTVDRLAQQHAGDELENTGFTVDYGAVDWVIPAGAWYYEGLAPIDAVGRIAAASGAVVMTSPSSDELRVRARYPASPWDWTTSPPGVTISDDIVFTESDALRSRPLYNAVVVSGELLGKGVTVRAVRDGEASVLYAEQVSDPMINTIPVATERARNILSDRGEQSEITIVLPVFSAPSTGQPGPVLPLTLVSMLSSQGGWVGLANALSITARWEGSGTASALVVDQTVIIERHYSDAN